MEHEALRYAHTEGHTDVCYADDGTSFITVGADGDLRIWSCEDSQDPVHQCVGEWALCVRQKNDKLYVATSSNDVQILQLPEGDRDGVLGRYVAPINHLAIGKQKDIFALAGEDMKVKLIASDRTTYTFGDDIKGPILSVALSPDCHYLAASCGDCKLRIWDVETRTSLAEFHVFPKVNSFSNANSLCRLDFEPLKGNLLAYPQNDLVVVLTSSDWTQFTRLQCDDSLTDGAVLSIVQFSPCGKFIAATSTKGDFIIWELRSKKIVGKSCHLSKIGISAFSWNPLNNGQIVYTDLEGQLSVISNCIELASQRLDEHDNTDEKITKEASDDEDDENVISVNKLKKQAVLEDAISDLEVVSRVGSLRSPSPQPQTPLQDCFMPTSTPEDLDPRYLCWNEVGVIRSYGHLAEDNEEVIKSIEVEFHEATFHNSMMIRNYVNFSMGALSRGALIVANSNEIKVIPLAGTTKEWTLKAESYEEVILVASSENFVAFATSNYLIRIATIFGIQRGIVSVSGPLVAMTAYKNQLLVAYHATGVRKHDQCINVKLFVFEGLTVVTKDLGSALGPSSRLMWLGFSDVGTPGLMDSLGMLSIYPLSNNAWTPFCDTTKHRDNPTDGFFVTALFESYQTVAGIKCKGSIYPGFTPRPTICELPLAPPFVEISTEKTQLEASLFMWSNLKVNNVGKKFQTTAIKAFALACRNDYDDRAMELMELLSKTQIIELAIKYASKVHKERLVENLLELIEAIATSGQEEKNNEIDLHTSDCTPETKVIKPLDRTLTLSVGRSGGSSRKRGLTPKSALEEVTSTNNETLATPLNTQESLFSTQTSEDKRKNPFLKTLKTPSVNPLSLTDKFAGIKYETAKKEMGEKRKKPNSESIAPKEKQRKLDRFMFKSKS